MYSHHFENVKNVLVYESFDIYTSKLEICNVPAENK